MGRTIGQNFRAGLAALAALAVVWAFVRVGSRPFRDALPPGHVELTVLHWGERDEDRITQSLVESFERANPTIHVRRINGSANYYAKLKTMFAAGDPPDVMFLNARDVPTYAGLGLLKDVGPLLETDGGEMRSDDFFDNVLSGFRFDGSTPGRGNLYGVPSNFTGLGFFYNPALFREAGVPLPHADWTWEEFEAACRSIGSLEGRHGCAVELTGDAVRAMLKTQGLELFPGGFDRVNCDDPGVVAWLERVRSWAEDPSCPRMVSFSDPYDHVVTAASRFRTGEFGLHGPTGRWNVPELRKVKLAQPDGSEAPLEWDFVPMPRGKTRGTILYVAAWCIAENTHHPREAWLLARHLATPEGQRQLSGYGLAIPSLRSIAKGPVFLDPATPPESDSAFLIDVEDAWPSFWPPNARFPPRFNDRLQESIRMRTRSVAGAMAEAEREWAAERDSPLRSGEFPPAPLRRVALGAAAACGLGAVVLAVLYVRGRPGPLRKREEAWGLAMIAPWALGAAVFVVIPMGISLYLSFTRWSGLLTIDRAQWVGLLNYRLMFTSDPRFVNALRLTVLYAVLAVPICQGAALLAAVLMSQPVRGVGVFRALWYLPSVLAGVGMAVMWRWVFDAEHGILNLLLRAAHLPAPAWLDRDAARWGVAAFVIASLWNIGGSMLVYLAGLKSIPPALYEAALVDGAGPVGRFLRVTVPMLSPVILFNVVIALIASFQVFTLAYVMTQGGPGDATRFYVVYLYNHAFEYHQMGYASAMAWVLLVIVLALTTVVMRLSRQRVHYEGMRA